MNGLVLVSGGLDSAVCLRLALDKYGAAATFALSVYYGQKHNRELAAAAALARHYGVRQLTVDLQAPFADSGCVLLEHAHASIPHGDYRAQRQANAAEPVSTYVPFRNGLFLAAAAAVGWTCFADGKEKTPVITVEEAREVMAAPEALEKLPEAERRQRLGRTQPTADLHRSAKGLDDLGDDRRMFWRAGKCTVEIDHMQLLAALPPPVRRLRGRIVAVDGDVILTPLTEAYAFAALEIDCRKYDHVS